MWVLNAKGEQIFLFLLNCSFHVKFLIKGNSLLQREILHKYWFSYKLKLVTLCIFGISDIIWWWKLILPPNALSTWIKKLSSFSGKRT